MNSWLEQTRDALADAAGVDPAELELSAAETSTLLDLARIAAHNGGARTNAPLLCYLVGLARSNGTALDDLADAVLRSSS